MIRKHFINFEYKGEEYNNGGASIPSGCENERPFIDVRNNVYGYRVDLNSSQFYINYLKYLNEFRDEWKIFGLLDLGYIPLAMGPSSLQDLIKFYAQQICVVYKMEYTTVKAIRVLQGGYMSNMEDIWVKRADIIRASGYSGHPMKFSVIEFLERKDVRDIWDRTFQH